MWWKETVGGYYHDQPGTSSIGATVALVLELFLVLSLLREIDEAHSMKILKT